ncbi:MAG: hypothetical protein OEX97_06100 [Acidimicrobiia bacterium]|nr:hypothetical protein [Acidimicrobiia bacterium]
MSDSPAAIEASGRRPVGEMDRVLGSALLRRVGALAFPTSVLVGGEGPSEGTILAGLGRDGWFRVFFGRGRRVELPDGTKWRLTAVGAGGFISPLVTCAGGKLAMATPLGRRSYGVNGRDYAYNLYPTNGKDRRTPTWALREHETDVATFGSRSMYATHPVPLAAALLCFTVIKYGVPGESNLFVPEFRWG